jgi:hypothetical protein
MLTIARLLVGGPRTGGSCQSSSEPRDEEETPEVESPLKASTNYTREGDPNALANRHLDMDVTDDERQVRNRK